MRRKSRQETLIGVKGQVIRRRDVNVSLSVFWLQLPGTLIKRNALTIFAEALVHRAIPDDLSIWRHNILREGQWPTLDALVHK